MKFFYTLLYLTLSYICHAQYLPEHNVHIIDEGYAPSGISYITSQLISEDYIHNGLQSVRDEIIGITKKHGGNVASIVIDVRTRKGKKHYYPAIEIWKADNPKDIKIVTQNEYLDSIKHRWLKDTTKQSMVFIYYKPPVKPNRNWGTALLSVNIDGTMISEPCALNEYTFCNFIVEGEQTVKIKTIYNFTDIEKSPYYPIEIKDKDFSITVKPGNLYFLVYNKVSFANGEIYQTDISEGYKTCRAYAIRRR